MIAAKRIRFVLNTRAGISVGFRCVRASMEALFGLREYLLGHCVCAI